jgi:hypothetical protein
MGRAYARSGHVEILKAMDAMREETHYTNLMDLAMLVLLRVELYLRDYNEYWKGDCSSMAKWWAAAD